MASSLLLWARDAQNADAGLNRSMMALVIVLLCLLIAGIGLVAGMLVVRRRRRIQRERELPYYHEKRSSVSSASTHRRIMTRPSEHVSYEKRALMEEAPLPPSSPKLPEIRITLPEEYDASGKRQSGKVVVVRISEHGEGLEPVDENVLLYQEKDGRFQSLDLERIGGLVETHQAKTYSR